MKRQIEVQKMIGGRIREQRRRRGWSQEHFGGLCSIHRSHMGAIERGESNLTLSTLLVISSKLEMEVAALLRRAD